MRAVDDDMSFRRLGGKSRHVDYPLEKTTRGFLVEKTTRGFLVEKADTSGLKSFLY